MQVSCAAVICVRNEEPYIFRTLNYLTTQGIEVLVIDHESTDETVSICREFLGKGLLRLETLEWKGVFDLTVQLKAKARITEQLQHDWIIHTDADEWLQSSVEEESLLSGITRMDRAGWNVINFDEFVFVPEFGQDMDERTHERHILNYYYFAPFPNRLMRAWKRSANLSNITSGGHKLSGTSVKLAPETFILRHYLVLSHKHALRKYVGRDFSEQDLAKNWHGNRLNIPAESLRLPPAHSLKRLPSWDSIEFDRSDPKKTVYWQW